MPIDRRQFVVTCAGGLGLPAIERAILSTATPEQVKRFGKPNVVVEPKTAGIERFTTPTGIISRSISCPPGVRCVVQGLLLNYESGDAAGFCRVEILNQSDIYLDAALCVRPES